MQPYPIQQGLWESLDGVLFNKALALAKDIAVELGVPPQALIQLLKKEERGKFAIVPDEDSTYQCKAFVQKGATYTRCRCTTFGDTCANHLSSKTDQVASLEAVQRLQTPDSTYMCSGEQVYTVDGNPCGTLKDDTLTLFEIE
jgi:hypothetical protein